MNDYLAYLSGACWDQPVAAQKIGGWGVNEAAEALAAALPVVDRCRGLSTYAVLRDGLSALYGFRGKDITFANWKPLNAKIVATYRRYGERAWQREVIRRAGVIKQVQICQLSYVTDHWRQLPPAERAAQAAILLPSLVLDGYLFTGFAQSKEGRERSQAILGCRPADYARHVAFCAQALDRFKREGGNSVKLLAAYTRTLRFEPVADADAAALHARGPEKLTGSDLQALQDNLLWRLLEMARERGFPLLVHTGYSIPSAWGDPEHLLNLLQSPRLKGLKIALCHSGWPREDAALILARTFRHCYFDMSWTPLLSPALGSHILSLAIDTLPMNKLLIGTDCGCAEMFYATARLIRRVLVEVLTAKMQAGQFGLDVAQRIACAYLYGNPREFFNLSELAPEPAPLRNTRGRHAG
jgi:hypothetical protein